MNTPKNFALQLGALITLYVSLSSLITLLFAVITLSFPDAADQYYQYESAASTIRFSIAMLIVFFPVYVYLTRVVNQIRRQEEGAYLILTKWAIYLSLLVGGAVLLGDLVAVLYSFLNGEITTRFILKAVVLAVGTSAAFYYYLKDAQRYWQSHERQSLYFGGVASLVVIISLVLGFINSDTPVEVRAARIDDNQIQDLQNIQWQIEAYVRQNETLPSDLKLVYEGGVAVPTAPENRPAYEYTVLEEDLRYELCATFAMASTANELARVPSFTEKNYSWTHDAGRWCFERRIDETNRL